MPRKQPLQGVLLQHQFTPFCDHPDCPGGQQDAVGSNTSALLGHTYLNFIHILKFYLLSNWHSSTKPELPGKAQQCPALWMMVGGSQQVV